MCLYRSKAGAPGGIEGRNEYAEGCPCGAKTVCMQMHVMQADGAR